jgi:hypothetical protein
MAVLVIWFALDLDCLLARCQGVTIVRDEQRRRIDIPVGNDYIHFTHLPNPTGHCTHLLKATMRRAPLVRMSPVVVSAMRLNSPAIRNLI